MICRVEMCVAEPAADNGDIDACCYKTDRSGMSKSMGRYSLGRQFGHRLRCSPDVLIQFETDSCGPERLSITVDEDRLIVRPRLSFQQGFEEIHGFRPDGAGPLFPALPHQPDLSR